jgi:hypothetical protein
VAHVAARHQGRCQPAGVEQNLISSASASGEPAGPIGPALGSSSWARRVAVTRSASARADSRRSHRRTVDTGRSSWAAIARCPAPPTLASQAAPITSAASRWRTTVQAGSKI